MIDWNLDRFVIDDPTKLKLKAIYPSFESELAKMEMWYLANPRKRKKNHYRFMVNWLNKSQSLPKPAIRDYKRENAEFKEKLMSIERTPPPPEWAALKERLKRENPYIEAGQAIQSVHKDKR